MFSYHTHLNEVVSTALWRTLVKSMLIHLSAFSTWDWKWVTCHQVAIVSYIWTCKISVLKCPLSTTRMTLPWDPEFGHVLEKNFFLSLRRISGRHIQKISNVVCLCEIRMYDVIWDWIKPHYVTIAVVKVMWNVIKRNTLDVGLKIHHKQKVFWKAGWDTREITEREFICRFWFQFCCGQLCHKWDSFCCSEKLGLYIR